MLSITQRSEAREDGERERKKGQVRLAWTSPNESNWGLAPVLYSTLIHGPGLRVPVVRGENGYGAK
ncbi:hypothetical protein GGP41_006258 [Bipolaris sorokiniana]|uniref:Uncharacterized protein n=1 Tax=Cochliobolus sativus TaxID=45130 RepID=A0A8H5ZKE8_COCSA|nr:hypothetical protein GGP41_006258 [Bipolaris sorokiniana]